MSLQLYKEGEAGFEANKILADDGKSVLGDSDWLGEGECRERKESKEDRVRARVHLEEGLREVFVSVEVLRQGEERRIGGDRVWRLMNISLTAQPLLYPIFNDHC